MRFTLPLLCLLAAAAAAAAPGEKLAPCLACHGESGQSQIDLTPSLGAQRKDYVLIQLYMFREKLRLADPMNEMAAGLSDDDLRQLSEAISQVPAPQPPAEPGDPARMVRGRALAELHHCVSCHNPDFSGRDNIARLADQREDYLAKTMREFKGNLRAGYDGSMASVMQPIDQMAIDDLAYYLAHYR
jgi:cytochrome c553